MLFFQNGATNNANERIRLKEILISNKKKKNFQSPNEKFTQIIPPIYFQILNTNKKSPNLPFRISAQYENKNLKRAIQFFNLFYFDYIGQIINPIFL